MKDKILIEIKKLSKHFNIGNKRVLKAVEDIDINIYRGETLGIVGESGCGKTTLGRTIINLYKPTKGKILYDGVDINSLKGKEIKKFKKSAQMIFQDPYASLDPKMTI
ncbi:ATP-binding cassette domain-containing protein, partial [Peptostreptococcus russellii]|uniref:ATP-binding cassette domain-containing protein n=1 Tax=Peptostreptococcus russellii TaxID=215200 RepID=UPI002942A804